MAKRDGRAPNAEIRIALPPSVRNVVWQRVGNRSHAENSARRNVSPVTFPALGGWLNQKVKFVHYQIIAMR